MDKRGKIGIIFILAGIFIPILALLFSSGYNPKADLIWNIKHTEIVIREQSGLIDNLGLFSSSNNALSKSIYVAWEYVKKSRIAIPCRYVFGFGIILTAIGIGAVALSQKTRERSLPKREN